MLNDLGRDKIREWSDDVWKSIDQAVADEHKLTAVAAQFLTPPVPYDTIDMIPGTVPADTVIIGDGGLLSVDESENRTIIEIAVLFKVRQSQAASEAKMKTAESLATRAANLLARGEDLIVFQGLAALNDPLFTSKSVILINPKNTNVSNGIDSFIFSGSTKIPVKPAETNTENPTLSIYGENTYAAVAEAYARLQEHHYGRQALVLPTTIYADTYATRTTTLDIPAITADRIKGLIGDRVYGTSTLPALDSSSPAKGVLLALDGNTMDLVVQMAPTVAVVPQDATSGDYVLKVYERFALRLKDPNAVIELDFVPGK